MFFIGTSMQKGEKQMPENTEDFLSLKVEQFNCFYSQMYNLPLKSVLFNVTQSFFVYFLLNKCM